MSIVDLQNALNHYQEEEDISEMYLRETLKSRKNILKEIIIGHSINESALMPFLGGSNFCTKFDPTNNFFKRRAVYHFKG